MKNEREEGRIRKEWEEKKNRREKWSRNNREGSKTGEKRGLEAKKKK